MRAKGKPQGLSSERGVKVMRRPGSSVALAAHSRRSPMVRMSLEKGVVRIWGGESRKGLAWVGSGVGGLGGA